MSAWLWLLISVVVVLVVPVAMRFAEEEPQNGTGEDLAAGPDEDDPDALLAAA
jgi:hypothetical protein